MKTMIMTGALAVAAAIGACVVALPADAAPAKKEPPSCAAISFRPVPAGVPDGEQDTGMYRSRFGKIEIKATVQGGTAKDYKMVLNGKPVEGGGNPPAASNACLQSKHVKIPFQKQAAGACTGERFRVVIDRSGAKPVALFFGLQGAEWAYCSGTTL